MASDFQGKVVLVTGAAGNLGRVVSKRFAEQGALLALTDFNEVALKVAADDAGVLADAVIAKVDITLREEVDAFVDRVVAELGRIDICVNVAGGFTTSPAYDTSEEVWDLMINLNAKSVLWMGGACARAMMAQGIKGRIINVASRAGLTGYAGISAYSAGKSAVIRLTESLAAELMPYGIRVNAVLPSTIDTPATRAHTPDADFSKWVTPESLSGVIEFLASDAARDISGASVPVYGQA